MSFGGWLKKQAKKAVGAAGDFLDSDLGWIIPPLKLGYESLDYVTGGAVDKAVDAVNGRKPGGTADASETVEPIIPLESDPFDQAAIAARQRDARRMADGVQETFLTGPGAGIKPGSALGPEQIITTMTGKEKKFEAATRGAPADAGARAPTVARRPAAVDPDVATTRRPRTAGDLLAERIVRGLSPGRRTAKDLY